MILKLNPNPRAKYPLKHCRHCIKLITCDAHEKIYGYPSLFELIEDIQNSGESQCSLGRDYTSDFN